MTGEKKGSDLSSRLGVRRSKTTAGKTSKSAAPAISAPPRAALATAKRFNDMLHPRASKERERARRVSNSATVRDERVAASLDEERPSEDGASDREAAHRVAELEQALAAALEEQKTMKEELAKLREHGTVYRETIEAYRRQLAGSYQLQSPPGAFHSDSRPASARSNSYESDTVPRPSSSRSRADLEGQNEDLRARVIQLQDQLMTQEVTHQSMLEQRRAEGQNEWDELRARLHATEKESQERLQQLLSLKSAFSSLTRVEPQVTDSELSETFSQLSNRVREWVISNFRSKMMRIFHEPIQVGLPETGPLASLRDIAATIRTTGDEYQNWRHTTIRSLSKSEARFKIVEGRKLQVHQLATDVLHHLITITFANLPVEAHSALETILDAAADFHTTLQLQKAQYSVQFPRNQLDVELSFDGNRMEPINELDDYADEEGDMIVDRTFSFCVFPGLEKWGDEFGDHTEVSNVLVKARVCCSIG
ncbi:hypothetical protein BU23DRAFT_525671 [Bimuria novae-zelandiae CBS 107.79]|uniref:Uncharacterized protein n=1 Tax=Bimuria novae-zelandiae CBS 107.79 TaxID=1447943 RepID=A0A6A5VMV3_9PLEO|nr:hypothetical protein BU23DRAFT_525671 [Bimuria novae-zelandiae CBS 107.79]